MQVHSYCNNFVIAKPNYGPEYNDYYWLLSIIFNLSVIAKLINIENRLREQRTARWEPSTRYVKDFDNSEISYGLPEGLTLDGQTFSSIGFHREGKSKETCEGCIRPLPHDQRLHSIQLTRIFAPCAPVSINSPCRIGPHLTHLTFAYLLTTGAACRIVLKRASPLKLPDHFAYTTVGMPSFRLNFFCNLYFLAIQIAVAQGASAGPELDLSATYPVNKQIQYDLGYVWVAIIVTALAFDLCKIVARYVRTLACLKDDTQDFRENLRNGDEKVPSWF